ncbi:MAG: DUF520 family protein [Ilumatobacteraceae bacterium]
MPSFDVVSEDRQEVRNAVDQAQREIATRFDFKNTNSSIEQNELSSPSARSARIASPAAPGPRGAPRQARRLAARPEATSRTPPRTPSVRSPPSRSASLDKAKEINKLLKAEAPKGVSSQTQGEQVRVSSKKRDDLQTVITLLKGKDLGIPLQFDISATD